MRRLTASLSILVLSSALKRFTAVTHSNAFYRSIGRASSTSWHSSSLLASRSSLGRTRAKETVKLRTQKGDTRDSQVTSVLDWYCCVCLASTSAEAQNDLLWQHADGRLAVWTMQRTNSVSGDPLGPGRLPDPLWQISAEADFNGDNHRDLVFQHQGDGRLAVWLMNRRAQVSGLALSPSQVPDLNWKVRGAGDFNGDFNGDFKPDLIWQNEATGQISVWLMDGTTRPDGNGRLLSPSVVADTDWQIVGVADFNRDGQSDPLWQHQISGLISVWHMNGLSRADGMVLSPDEFPDTDLKLRAVGDVNGDHWPDLVWQNQVTGLLSAWFMRDVQRLGEVLLSPDHVADTNWRIVGIRPPGDYSGVYTLTITARSCSSGFPEELKRRVYTARVEQSDANLRVSLSGADFLARSRRIVRWRYVCWLGQSDRRDRVHHRTHLLVGLRRDNRPGRDS